MIEEITWITDGRTPEHLVDVLIKVGSTCSGGYFDPCGWRWARGEEVMGEVLGWAPMPKGPEAPKRGNRRGKK